MPIPIGALAAVLLVRMGQMADSGHLSMSDPGMPFATLLLFVVLGISVFWVTASGFIHINLRKKERNGEVRNLKSYAGITIFFIIMAVLVLSTPLWMLGIAVFALYLFVISVRVFILDRSSEDRNN